MNFRPVQIMNWFLSVAATLATSLIGLAVFAALYDVAYALA